MHACPLEEYFEVVAVAKPDEPRTDRRILHQVTIRGNKIKAL